MSCNSTTVGSFHFPLYCSHILTCRNIFFMDFMCSCKHTGEEYSPKEALTALDQTRIVCLFIVHLCCVFHALCQSGVSQFGNLNLGTLDAVDFICSVFCSARLSAHPGVIKGSFNICNLLGVFFSFFLSFLCVCPDCHSSND